MASSSVSQEDVETDFQLLSRRSKIRAARARNPQAFSQRPGDEMEAGEDREESPKPSAAGKAKDRRPANRTERPNYVGNKGKLQRDRRKLREKRRSTGVVHLQSTESTGGSTGEDEGEHSPSRDETKRNTAINEGAAGAAVAVAAAAEAAPKTAPSGGGGGGGSGSGAAAAAGSGPGPRNYIGPSDLEADDEDTQDGDSLSHLKLDAELASLDVHDAGVQEADAGVQEAGGGGGCGGGGDAAEALARARLEIRQLGVQLGECRREISLLKAERDFLREQNLGLRNQAVASAAKK